MNAAVAVAESAERARLRRTMAVYSRRAADARNLHRLALQSDLLAEAALLEESADLWANLARSNAESLRALASRSETDR